MSDVRPPVIAIPKTDPLKDKVCPTCRRANVEPGRGAPLTGIELRDRLNAILAINLAHRIRVRLAPGVTVDVLQVHHGGGGVEGFWCELEAGRMNFDATDGENK